MSQQNCQVTADEILSVFGHGELYLGRHGNALKADPDGQPDIDRSLSSLGLYQAELIAERLRGARFDLVLASPAKRARDTASIITNRNHEQLGTVSAFGISEDKTNPLNVMFAELAYAPLAKYHEHALASHLHELGLAALYEIVTFAKAAEHRGCARVFVGGHAVFHPQVAYTMGKILLEAGYHQGGSLMDWARQIELGEAEVMVIEFSLDDGVSLNIWPSLIKPTPARAN